MFGHVVFGDFRRVSVARAISFALILGSAAQAENFFWNPSTALLNGGADVNKTANWSQVNNGGGAWPKSSFDDDFSANTLNPVWAFVDADNDATTGSFSVTSKDDSLTLTSRGKDIWLMDNEYVAVWREDITGDFDVSVKVSSLTGNSDGWAKTGIRVTNNHNNFAAGGSFAVVVSAKHGILVQFDSTGAVGDHDYPSTDGVSPLTPVFPVWVRAAKKGGVFYGYYKTTLNAPWTLLRAANPQVNAVDSHIGLFLTSHNPGATATAVFDDFQASGPVPTAPMDLSFSGTSATADSNARLSANLTAGSVDMTGYTGIFSFGASTLTVTGAKADFSATALIDAGTGGLAFPAATGIQVFSPAQGAVFPAIAKSGAGTLQIAARPLTAVSLSISGGVIDLGGLTNQFAGINATGGSFTNMDANDSLIVTGDANFSGLTALPAAGNVQIRSQSGPSAAQILIFTPGNAAFNNLYLWAIGAAASPARIVTGAGTLQVKGNLILRDEKLEAGTRGVLDFRTNNASVNVEGNLLRVENGSGAAPSQQLLMGGGTWAVKGNASLSFGNSGSADLSTLEFSGAAPAVQTLTISNGAAANVKHSGTGTLNLGAALSGASLTQSAGTLNFNENNVSVTGNISVTNGTATTLIGLGGRDLHAGGNISLTGQSGNLLNLNPGARWTLSADGTLEADFAAIANSAATAPLPGEAAATCTNGGNNTGWHFPSVAADFTKQPGNVTALAGQKAVFSVSVSGSPAPTFAWRKRADTTVLSREAVLTIASADPAANGAHYYCTINNGFGDVESADGILTVNEPPTITGGPKDSSVVLGSPVSFAVSVAGTPPFAYKWYRVRNAAVVADTNAVMRIAPTAAANDGDSLYCTVTNAFGTATSKRAALKINFPAKVTVQPKNATVVDGGNARFSVTASGSGTITFAWFRSGAADTLGKDSVFTVKALLANDTSKYFCVVHNVYGQESSQLATLSVVKGVLIVREPASITVAKGKKAVFTVQAVGGGPLTYKWMRKGDTASLSKDSVFTIDSAKVADDKSVFIVRVADKFSADTSKEAILTVADCDSLFKVEPESLTVDEGQPLALKGVASCADKYQWSVVSGPARPILDPEVLTLGGTAPRVLADSVIVYRFSGVYGPNPVAKNVVVKVREAIPDPLITLPVKTSWPGANPLVLRPVLANAAALKGSKYHPDLHYQWFLSEALADTAQAGDSLKLSNPVQDGLLDITLCVDNGGAVQCAASEIQIGRSTAVLAARGLHLGSLVLEENALFWIAPGRVLIRDGMGRVLWQGQGKAGGRSRLDGGVRRALTQRRAFLEFRP
jgi:hypothetical protein